MTMTAATTTIYAYYTEKTMLTCIPVKNYRQDSIAANFLPA